MGANFLPWIALGTLVVSSITLAIVFWVNIIKPKRRERNLSRPVQAHFTIWDSRQSVSGRDVSGDDPHLVRRLTLPSNQTTDIEIGLKSKIPIYVSYIIVGCGDAAAAPVLESRSWQHVKSGAGAHTSGDYTSHDGSYHARVDHTFNVGTHFVIGFRVRTLGAGHYPVSLVLVTNEIEGNYEGLEILVEDTPTTRMLCHAKNHGLNCLVSPVPLEKDEFAEIGSVAKGRKQNVRL
jgi:hypothetical protein